MSPPHHSSSNFVLRGNASSGLTSSSHISELKRAQVFPFFTFSDRSFPAYPNFIHHEAKYDVKLTLRSFSASFFFSSPPWPPLHFVSPLHRPQNKAFFFPTTTHNLL